jgi:membrane fusion protein
MNENLNPFRKEAIDAKGCNSHGNIIIIRPLSFNLITAFSILVIISACALIYAGKYSKRVSASGYLRPESGIIRIYTPQAGILISKMVDEGQYVSQNQELFRINIDSKVRNQDSIQKSKSDLASHRLKLLKDERSATESLERHTVEVSNKKISQLLTQKLMIENQINGQRHRLKIAEELEKKYKKLLEIDAISQEGFQQKFLDVLDQNDKLQMLQRETVEISQSIYDAKSEIQAVKFRTTSQLAQLDRDISTILQEIMDIEEKIQFSVVAPQSGVVQGLTVEAGQFISADREMGILTPVNSSIIAEVFATDRTVGFLKEDSTVLLQMHAYPFEKFGHVSAKIKKISSTPTKLSELHLPFNPSINGNLISDEPVYRISAILNSPEIKTEVTTLPLRTGMRFNAILFQEEKKLWEWIIDPIRNLKTNVSSSVKQ